MRPRVTAPSLSGVGRGRPTPPNNVAGEQALSLTRCQKGGHTSLSLTFKLILRKAPKLIIRRGEVKKHLNLVVIDDLISHTCSPTG